MSSEFEVKKGLLEKILPNLMCASCKTPPRPDGPGQLRHVCSNCGKGICGLCFNSANPNCSSYSKKGCSGKIPQASCLSINDTLMELPVACKNRKSGCQEICLPNYLESHEEECVYRFVFCAKYECKVMVPLVEYPNHAKSCVLRVEKEDPFLWTVSDGLLYASDLDLTSKFDRPFYQSVYLIDNQVISWVYLLGSHKSASRFVYTLAFTNPNNPDEKITYSGSVRSMDISPGDAISEGAVFQLAFHQLRRFKDEDERVFYQLTIRDLKEEAKDENEDSGLSD